MKHCLYILILCNVISATAQNMPYSLAWCLEQGLKNNFSIQIAENNQKIAEENDSWANAGALPTIDLSAGYGIDVTSARSNLRATGETTNNIGYQDNSMNAKVNVTWTVFDGLGIQASHKELSLLHQQGDLLHRIAVEDLISDITAEYYNCIQHRIRLRNYRNAVRLSRERVRIVEERYNIGNFSRLDYMQAKVDFNADSAQYMKQQELFRSSQIELNRLINNKEEMGKRIALADSVIAVATILDYDALWQDLLAYNTSLQQAALSKELAQQSLRKVLSRNYPYVRLNASYGYNRYDYEIAANKWSDRWGPSAGVTVGMNLFDGSKRSSRHAAQRNLDNRALAQEDLMLSLEARFKTLSQSHSNNLQILHLEEQNLVTAQENYEIARERYLLGDLSGFEMREAQQSLLRAEERILTAAYNTKMCEISLLLISGRIDSYL